MAVRRDCHCAHLVESERSSSSSSNTRERGIRIAQRGWVPPITVESVGLGLLCLPLKFTPSSSFCLRKTSKKFQNFRKFATCFVWSNCSEFIE